MKNLYLLKIGSRWLDASISKSNTLTWTPSFTAHQKCFGKKRCTKSFQFYFEIPSFLPQSIRWQRWWSQERTGRFSFASPVKRYYHGVTVQLSFWFIQDFAKFESPYSPPSNNLFYQFKIEEVIFQMWKRAFLGANSTTSKEWHRDIGPAMWHLKDGSLSG